MQKRNFSNSFFLRSLFSLLLFCGCSSPSVTTESDGGQRTHKTDGGPYKADAGEMSSSPSPAGCATSVFASFTLTALAAGNEMQPNGEGFVLPSTPTLRGLEASISALLAGDESSALILANEVGYGLCEGNGEEAGIFLWHSQEPGPVRFLWRKEATRDLFVEVPHPYFERGTLAEGVALFKQLQARLLLVSGHHRCASDLPSGCDGTTSVCGSRTFYSISDPAHVVEDGFSAVHARFAELFLEAKVLSLHGMSDEGLSVSNGTTQSVAADSFHARLVSALVEKLPESTVTTCNGFVGTPQEVRLCGTTNVQGRSLNDVENSCTTAALLASDRFIHVEQSPLLRDNYLGLLRALDEVLP